jgi:hypothetical protein
MAAAPSARFGQRLPPAVIRSTGWCAPDTGVNWWGESPLCRNAVRLALITGVSLAEVLDRGNCGIARSRGKEAAGNVTRTRISCSTKIPVFKNPVRGGLFIEGTPQQFPFCFFSGAAGGTWMIRVTRTAAPLKKQKEEKGFGWL